MSTIFSAVPQALGYLFQTIAYSLYVMMENLDYQDRYLRIEKFDDIEVVDADTAVNSFQIKRTKVDLTNRSSDYWKTIRVWSETFQQGKLKIPGTILTIVTTANVPDNSIASFLRREEDKRKPTEALKMMLNEMANTTSSLAKEFSAFAALSKDQQSNLVNSIEILDCAPDFNEISEKVKTRFYAVRQENRDEVLEDLLSWWFSKVVEHLLSKSETLLSVSSVQAKLADINDRVKARTLKDPFLNEAAPVDYDWDKRTFVLQMRVIGLHETLKRMGIQNYYHASRLRTWLVEELHIKELASYDQRLKEEWAYRFYSSEMSGDETTEESEQKKRGQKVFEQIMKEVDIPIHTDIIDRNVTRGSYQILADQRENLEIGWHPNFREILATGCKDET